jgi:hypothetical protein
MCVSVFDVDIPAAGACTVHPVGRANHFIMLPSISVYIFPIPVFISGLAVLIGMAFNRREII